MAQTTVAERAQPKIHDYAVLGDGRSAALVSRDGSVDWLAWPRFESPSIFARLLDLDRGGSFRIGPPGPTRIERRYVERTNVLETTFEDDAGRCVLVDLMTVASEPDKRRMLVPDHEILRIVRCERGEMALEARVEPRPGYGRSSPRTARHDRLGLRWELGSALLTLRAEVPIALDEEGNARASFRLGAGQSVAFSLSFDEEGPAVIPPLGAAATERLERTIDWWRGWIGSARYDGPYRDLVLRSALAVKLMGFAPSGAIVAAPTTSLPERIGGPLNWDYRYCWLRDASFTARALLGLGYVDEATAFVSWLLHTTRLTRPELRVMYDVYGRAPPGEDPLPEWRGYRGSRPIRVGNAAFDQLQLDCYGEVIDAASQIAHVVGSLDRETQALLGDFGRYVCDHWRLADHGIWEPRERPRHHTHSRLLSWVALDRLIDLADEGLLVGADRDRLATERAAIRADVEAHAFHPTLSAYTGILGDAELDASVLLMTWYGFHFGEAPRMRSTWARVRERLSAGPGLFYRYEDSRADREGAFWVCSFWAIEHLARGGGTLAEADALMRAASAYASDLGLMAEEIDPPTGEGLGNFPQAYTHVGLISAAVTLEERVGTIGTPRSEHLAAPPGAGR